MNEKRATEEHLRIRVHGDAENPTLIYLPGLHGDWTLVTRFRLEVQNRYRFVEFTYPRTLEWSLEDYADAIEAMLLEHEIANGWVIGESFGSQIVWPLVGAARSFKPDGVILAGGFGRHPMKFGVNSAKAFCAGLPLSFITWALFCYAPFARFRFGDSPEAHASIKEFIARRTQLDKCAGAHRLQLIANNDPRQFAAQVQMPVYHLSGFWDPVVPWPMVRSWLKRHCPGYREGRLIASADHNVLATGTEQAAAIVDGWINA